MKRKMFFLSSVECDKNVVDNINTCFDKGYEIEKILNADCGYYIILSLDENENYMFKKKYELPKYNCNNLIEESTKKWVTTITDKNIDASYMN